MTVMIIDKAISEIEAQVKKGDIWEITVKTNTNRK